MRDSTILLLGSLLLAVACVAAFLISGGPQKMDDRSQPPELPKVETPKIPDPVLKGAPEEPPHVIKDELAFDGPAGRLVDAYKDDRIAADAKYKDRRVRVSMRVDAIGRTGDDTPYLATTHIGDLAVFEPNLFAHFSKFNEGTVAGSKRGDAVTLEGVCRGRFNDGIVRQIKGYEFVVQLARCRIAP